MTAQVHKQGAVICSCLTLLNPDSLACASLQIVLRPYVTYRILGDPFELLFRSMIGTLSLGDRLFFIFSVRYSNEVSIYSFTLLYKLIKQCRFMNLTIKQFTRRSLYVSTYYRILYYVR